MRTLFTLAIIGTLAGFLVYAADRTLTLTTTQRTTLDAFATSNMTRFGSQVIATRTNTALNGNVIWHVDRYSRSGVTGYVGVFVFTNSSGSLRRVVNNGPATNFTATTWR